MSFSIRYAIPMNGPGCARSVETKLGSLEGFKSVDVDLANQEAVVTGQIAPSSVVESMQAIGRDAFIRGSGQPNSAAVAILETQDGKIQGLTRLIQVSEGKTLFDVTVDRTYAGTSVDLFSFGNLSNPPETLGSKLFNILKVPFPSAPLKTQPTVSTYAILSDKPLSSLIGRAVHTSSGLSGIVARSAGLWENDKVVCTCSGKTVWEERHEFREQTNGHL